MSADHLLLIATAAAVGGIAVLRAAWARPSRSIALNGAGWGLVAVSAICGWLAAGAWGTSIAALWSMIAAFVVLGGAALASKPGKAPASNRRVGMLPEGSEPLRIGGRLLTFVLVALVCAVFAGGAALAVCALALLAGSGRADAYVLAFFMMPVAWAGIAYAVLMQPARRGQFKVLALSSLPTWPILAAGILS